MVPTGTKFNTNVILPNVLTLLGLLSGFYSILMSLDGKFVAAAYCMLLAAVFDNLDGKIARLINGCSEFGVQLDSLADLVSFGVAPALLVYEWALKPYGRIGMMAAFLFVACGALRLARFNVQTKKISNKYFVGLPIPAAASVIASSVLFAREFFGDVNDITIPMGFVFAIYILAFLMVSTIPFPSFKASEKQIRKPFNKLVMFVLVIYVLGMYPELTFFIASIVYISAGLLNLLLQKKIEYRSVEEEAEHHL